MKQLTKTRFIITNCIILFIIISLSMNSQENVNAAESIVSAVTHEPDTVFQNTIVTIQITFLDDSDVNHINIQYCSLEPDFTCHFPKTPMTQQGTNIWIGNFTVVEASGIIGYELIITLNNETEIKAPNSFDYLGYDNIAEPETGVFYFTVELSTPTQNSLLNVSIFEFGGVFLGVIVIRVIFVKRRGNA